MATDEQRRTGAIGGLTSWVNTVDREARMRPLTDNSPARLDWHLRELGYDPATATQGQRKQAESARKLYYARLSEKGVAARKINKSDRLRRRAQELLEEAEIAEIEERADASWRPRGRGTS